MRGEPVINFVRGIWKASDIDTVAGIQNSAGRRWTVFRWPGWLPSLNQFKVCNVRHA